MSLVENITTQKAELEAIGKTPMSLKCDPASFDALLSEMGTLGFPPTFPMRIYGLDIQICSEPNFEVVVEDTLT